MKRAAWALLLVLLCLLAPVARAEQPVRLWHAYRGDEERALQLILASFAGEVELLAVPYDAFASKLESSIPLGEGPDLYIDAHERLGDYAQRGIVAAVPPALAAALTRERYLDKTIAAVTVDGQPLALPISQKCLALYVNTDLLPEPPATLEQLAALADVLPDGSFALAYEARGAYAHAALLAAFGGALLDVETDDFAFEGPAAERSLELAVELIERGVVPEDADGALVTNLFRSGQAATAISGPWLAADLGDAIPYRVVLLPIVEETGQRMRPLLTVEAVMLSPQGAQNPDALRLLEHLASSEAAAIRASTARSLTARSDVPLPDDPLLRAFAEQAALADPTPSTAAMRAVWEPANKAIRKVMRGDVEADEALAEARRRFDDVRRPPPPPASPTPLIIMLGLACLLGAFALLRRAKLGEVRAALRESLPAYAYIGLGVIAVGVLVILPIVFGAGAALFAGKPHDMHYVGLANFREILTARGMPLLSSGSFYVVLAVTVLWTVVNVAFHLGIGMTLGLALSRPTMRLRGLYRVLLIVPWAVPSYVTALAWRGMFHRQFGAVTGLIHALNDLFGLSIEPIAWFARFSTAFAANVATNVWLGFPFMMVVTLGALTAVPKDVLEAAEVDGASRWQRLTRITLPMIAPTMIPAVTLGAIWTFNMFNVVFLVSGGDPDGTTDILISEAYRWAFTREAQYGYAAAYAVLIFLLLLLTSRLADRFMLGARARST
ncbi:MAG TPA: extracellular solute-binding protein [Enhygromyxa sp.]|nr:extracellular solute-binding protein [Enhygromyxa sp.]